MRSSTVIPFLLAASALLLATGCASAPPASPSQTTYQADGIFVRHLRVRLAPSHTQAFEDLFERCVEAAQAARLPDTHDWLCYREPPGRYWLLWFGEAPDGFALSGDAHEPDPLATFVARFDSPAGDLLAQLAKLDTTLEWSVLHQQKSEWSTVQAMSTHTHPKARIMLRSVRPGSEAAFDRALSARTGFLDDHDYPLPIEGFVTHAGAPGTAAQVVFPTDWPSFYATGSFGAFVRALDPDAQADYAVRKQALMLTMDSAEYYDGSFVPELSYRAKGE